MRGQVTVCEGGLSWSWAMGSVSSGGPACRGALCASVTRLLKPAPLAQLLTCSVLGVGCPGVTASASLRGGWWGRCWWGGRAAQRVLSAPMTGGAGVSPGDRRGTQGRTGPGVPGPPAVPPRLVRRPGNQVSSRLFLQEEAAGGAGRVEGG